MGFLTLRVFLNPNFCFLEWSSIWLVLTFLISMCVQLDATLLEKSKLEEQFEQVKKAKQALVSSLYFNMQSELEVHN